MRALITGGSEGLGAALVSRLLASGAQVCNVDRAPQAAQSPARLIRCDLTRQTDIAALPVSLATDGPFDLVVMSAGTSAVGPFEAMTEAQVRDVHDLNILAPVLLTRDLLAHDLIAPGGRLVLVASLSHFTGYPGASVYAGSKDALVAFARSLRRPLWSDKRIRVQVAAPGPMRTAHAERHAPPGSSGRGRADPDRIAAAILRARRRAMIVPGAAAGLMALFGRLFPGQATQVMRRLIYDRLT